MICVFCDIRDDARDTFVAEGSDWFAIEPLNPYVPGHLLFIPKPHIPTSAHDPRVAGFVFEAAAEFASERCSTFNLLTSVGAQATQTVMHLHVHLIPRGPDDGIPFAWPWTGEVR